MAGFGIIHAESVGSTAAESVIEDCKARMRYLHVPRKVKLSLKVAC
jgi:hypothetical protein